MSTRCSECPNRVACDSADVCLHQSSRLGGIVEAALARYDAMTLAEKRAIQERTRSSRIVLLDIETGQR